MRYLEYQIHTDWKQNSGQQALRGGAVAILLEGYRVSYGKPGTAAPPTPHPSHQEHNSLRALHSYLSFQLGWRKFLEMDSGNDCATV